jgi:iron complex transport system ATP-binding protein
MMLAVNNLTVRCGKLAIVDDVSFSVPEGAWLMIVGPNGAGKSTILNAVAQGAPYTGDVLLGGADARKLPARERAKRLGMLMQTHAVGYGFTVEEVVRLGRYAYARGAAEVNDAAVDRALVEAGLVELRAQSVLTLSGGELQRTFLAQALAQDPAVLLLDEPVNHLDLAYQRDTFALMREWLKAPGRALVSVVHDLSLALAFGTAALLLDRGRVVALGVPRDVLTREHLERVYGLDVHGWMRSMLAQWEG